MNVLKRMWRHFQLIKKGQRLQKPLWDIWTVLCIRFCITIFLSFFLFIHNE